MSKELIVTDRAAKAIANAGKSWAELMALVDSFNPVAETEINNDDDFANAKSKLKELNAEKDSAVTITKEARADAASFAKEVVAAENELLAAFEVPKTKLQQKIELFKLAKELEEAKTPKGQLKSAKKQQEVWEKYFSAMYMQAIPASAVEWDNFIKTYLVIDNGPLGSPEASYGQYLDGLQQKLSELIANAERVRNDRAIAEDLAAFQSAKRQQAATVAAEKVALQEQVIEAQRLALANNTVITVAEIATPLPEFVGDDRQKLKAFMNHIAGYAERIAPSLDDKECAELLVQVLANLNGLKTDVEELLNAKA